jgi:amidase
LHELFRSFDVVLFPPMPTAAFPQDESDDGRTIDIDGTAYPYDLQMVYASLATAPGLPATTVPLERTRAGLPVGVTVIGAFLEDRTTLRFAELVEEAFGGFVPPPGMG